MIQGQEGDDTNRSENVVVIVEDFNSERLNHVLFGELRKKMMSTNFRLIETVKHDFRYPFEVKISYLYDCVLVTDYYNSRITTFDLKTKMHLSNFSIAFPRCCTVERTEKTDFLIVACITSAIFKFDIKDILANDSSEKLWENDQDCNWPNGLDVRYQHPHNLIYVCDTDENVIRVLNSINGELVKNIYSSPSLTIDLPWSICIGRDYLMFGSHSRHSITVVSTENFTKIREIQDESFGEFKLPCSIIIDEETENLIVSSSQNQTVQIFNKQGLLFKHSLLVDGATEILGIALNHLTGELFVVSSDQHAIMVFK